MFLITKFDTSFRSVLYCHLLINWPRMKMKTVLNLCFSALYRELLIEYWYLKISIVAMYSSVLLIFSGHLIPSILLKKFLCRTSIWSSRSCVTVHSALLYRNMLRTYASSVLIFIMIKVTFICNRKLMDLIEDEFLSLLNYKCQIANDFISFENYHIHIITWSLMI